MLKLLVAVSTLLLGGSSDAEDDAARLQKHLSEMGKVEQVSVVQQDRPSGLVITVDGQLTVRSPADRSFGIRSENDPAGSDVYEQMALETVREIRKVLNLGEATLRASDVDSTGAQTYVRVSAGNGTTMFPGFVAVQIEGAQVVGISGLFPRITADVSAEPLLAASDAIEFAVDQILSDEALRRVRDRHRGPLCEATLSAGEGGPAWNLKCDPLNVAIVLDARTGLVRSQSPINPPTY